MTTEQKREVATTIILKDFFFECYKKGLDANESKLEAIKYDSEIASRINGLVKEM